ncbi:ATP-binding protein [Sphingobacterium sp.]|uniref:ATP-binding protein n=1 Tax=Sphingobacterium sp. TaxID=341027 RepID=UPI0038B42524
MRNLHYNSASLIIATQIPVEKWHGLIGESTIADAILDRVTFSSHRVCKYPISPTAKIRIFY